MAKKKKEKMYAKEWRCPFNHSDKSPYLSVMVDRVAAKYSHQYEPYKKKGITIKQLLFNYRNKYPLDKTHGTCIVTKKPTKWNEYKCKYERIVNPQVAAEWNKNKAKQLEGKYGVPTLLKYSAHQKGMLHNRKISGTYNYDGVKVGYVAKNELDFLKRADKLYHIEADDIEVEKTFYYEYKGAMHEYYLDFFIISLNLGIEIKGNSPFRNFEKEKLKEKAVRDKGHDYIFVLDKDYDILDDYMEEHIPGFVKPLE